MDKTDYLPLGSIVIVKGGVKKSMIIARGLAAPIGDEVKFFDYGGCLYPEGLIGDSLIYFNHEDLEKVVFEGFSDEDNELMVKNINEWAEKSGFPKGNPFELNQQNLQKELEEKKRGEGNE